MSSRIVRGVVRADARENTVAVEVSRKVKHPKYRKYINITKSYLVHDEKNSCVRGDKVDIVEVKPISKRKKWAVVYK